MPAFLLPFIPIIPQLLVSILTWLFTGNSYNQQVYSTVGIEGLDVRTQVMGPPPL